MNEKLLHTPEGVRDIYDAECKKKKKVISQIHHVLELYSYQDIDTPSFEYFDIFNMDKGSAASNEMYKFFDRNNNTLVLRPDITPSIARSVAKYYPEEQLPIRLCYAGNTFLNTHQHQGKLSEFTQIGGELINDDSSAADAEIIACVIHCLLAAGLKEFQIEIGEVEFFKGMIEEAGLDDETEQRIKEYIHSKNFFGLTEFVNTLEIPEERKTALKSFESLFGGLDMLDHAEKLVTNAASLEAIARMRKVYTALTSYGYEKYVSFDLSMINRFNYYTGIVFRGYTYGTGDAIVKGGRYNSLMEKFGKKAPSVGFAIYVDDLMSAIARNKIDVALDYSNVLVLYKEEDQKEAIAYACKLRAEDQKVELVRMSRRHDLQEYIDYAHKMHFAKLCYFEAADKITKGRLAKKTLAMFEQMGITCEEAKDPDTRKLIFTNEEHKIRFFLAKASDVPTYVEYGAADIGVVGKDTIMEEGRNLYEVMDLGFGRCRMCVCGPASARELLSKNEIIRVASKYPNIAKNYFSEKKNQTVEIIKLNGSVELAPLVDLSEVIVDIVETGSTLRENGLEVLEEICPLSARVVVNQVSLKMEHERIRKLLNDLNEIIH